MARHGKRRLCIGAFRLEVCLLVFVLAFSLQFLWLTTRVRSLATSSTTRSTGTGLRNGTLYQLRNPQVRGKSKGRLHQRVVRRKKKAGWDPGSEGGNPVQLNVQLPIFVASLPKSGTTSIWQYFNCGGHLASHQWVKQNETFSEQSGRCIRRNVEKGRPPFESCGTYDVYVDAGFAVFLQGGVLPKVPTDCYYPSMQALDAIYKHYPNSTIVNILRDTTSWYESMVSWGNGSLLDRWKLCNITGLPVWGAKAKGFLAFYEWHTENLRNFAKSHPGLTYIEIPLESPDAGKMLEDAIGIPSNCWGVCKPNYRFCQKLG